MTPQARQRAEFLAREVARLMDIGVPRDQPLETWLADYFMRFAQDELRREAVLQAGDEDAEAGR